VVQCKLLSNIPNGEYNIRDQTPVVNSASRYNPIQKYGPQDCVSSINAIIENIDRLVASGNEFAILGLKEVFGLEAVIDIRDFAQAIAFPRKPYILSHENR
jgi:hypothetical protein